MAVDWRGESTRIRGAALAVVPMLVALTFEASRRPIAYLDTLTMLHGVARAEDCLRAGQLTGCDSYTDIQFGPVGPFPPLQYLPTAAFKALGVSPHGAITGLAVISALAFAVTVVVSYLVGKRTGGTRVGCVLAIGVLTGPLLYYSTTAYGEPLAALAVTLFVAALLLEWHPAAIALAGFAAAITKETTAPFLLAVALVVVYAVPRTQARRTMLAAVVAGVVAGVALCAAFNYLRYGSPLNEYYLQRPLTVHHLGQRIRFFGALIAAPNGGLFWFWLPALGLIAWLSVVAARGPAKWLGLAPLVLLVAQLAGLASWFSPFGWDSWGPRLALPWMPALVLLAAALAGREGTQRVADTLSRSVPLAAAVGLVCLAIAVSELGLVADPDRVPRWFGETCPNVQFVPDAYYRCYEHRAWIRHPIALDAAEGIGSPKGLLLLALYGAGAGVLFVAVARRERTGAWAP